MHLRLSALACALLAACTTTDLGHIQATWALADIDATGQQTGATCPSGYDTAELHTAVSAGDGTLADPCITLDSQCYVDVFDCAAGEGLSSPLPPGNYTTWIEITSHDGQQVFATSQQQVVLIGTRDVAFETTLLDNGGAFRFAWLLEGETSGQVLTCEQAGAATISASATIGTQMLTSSTPCTAPFGYSEGLPPGDYTLAVAAIDSGGQPLGTTAASQAGTIGAMPDQIDDLGTLVVPVAGM
ncbi:MAG TPA: hypothetical protein VGF94_21665 [Kofleriaceae bacterium]|jgi:hypothetical protein